MPIKGIVFDMDGVLRFGDHPANYCEKLIEFIKNKEIPTMVVTNECRYTRETILNDLKYMNLNIPKTWQLYTSGIAVRDYICSQVVNHNKSLYAIGIVGEVGLKKTIEPLELYNNCRIFDDPRTISENDFTTKILVIGTLNNISNDVINKCNRWINAGAKIIITCPDVYDPGYDGYGLISPTKTIHLLSFQRPQLEYYNVGKPNPLISKQIKRFFKTHDLSDILFVGDTLDTDIRLANESGMKSCYVISSKFAEASLSWSIHRPNYICRDLVDVKDVIDHNI